MKDGTTVKIFKAVILFSFITALCILTATVSKELHNLKAEHTINGATECKSRMEARSAVFADLGKKEQTLMEKKK